MLVYENRLKTERIKNTRNWTSCWAWRKFEKSMYEDIGSFSNDAPRHVSTGKTTEAAFVSNKIRAQELGMLQ